MSDILRDPECRAAFELLRSLGYTADDYAEALAFVEASQQPLPTLPVETLCKANLSILTPAQVRSLMPHIE